MQEQKRYKIRLYISAVIIYFFGLIISAMPNMPREIRFLGDTLEIVVFYFFVCKCMMILTQRLTKSKTARILTVAASVLIVVLRVFQTVAPKFNDETYFLFILPVYLPLLMLIWYIFWHNDPEKEESEPEKKRFGFKNVLIICALLIVSLASLAANVFSILA